MTSEAYAKPLPLSDDNTAPFWEEARTHRLAFQRCQHCGAFAHPPVTFCQKCHNVDEPSFRFEHVQPRGRVVNWTVIHDQMALGFENEGPTVWILAEMTDQPGLLFPCALEEGRSDWLRIGIAVDVVFRDVAPGVALPYFRLAQTDCDKEPRQADMWRVT